MSENLTPRDLTSSVPRRAVLAGGGAAACACALSACGGGSGSSNPSVNATIKSSTVPVGGGLVDSKNNVVVTQVTKGSFKAFSSVCTHQGCQVGSVSDGTITCPCHGSEFDAATGKVKNGPATSPLPEKKVQVQGDTLHVTD